MDGNNNNSGRAWPPSSSRGVAPGFRNFCITAGPDVIFSDPPRDPSTSEATKETETELETPPLPSRPSSTSSSIQSCSPITSPFSISSTIGSSIVSGIDISSLPSTSSDEEEDKAEPAERVTVKVEVDKDLLQNQLAEAFVAVPSLPDIVPSTSSSFQGTLRGQNETHCFNEDGQTDAPLASGSTNLASTSPAVAYERNDMLQFLHHKKFHYKKRAKASSSQSGTAKRASEEPVPSLGGLRLSPYITREQAESRLRALGSIEETQREIDAFAAIICTGAMYRMNMNENADTRETPVQNERLFPQGNVNMTISASPSGQQRLPLTSSSPNVGIINERDSSSAMPSSSDANATMLGADNTSIKMEVDYEPIKRGGYFQVTSPGQASNSDDYEWISD